MSWIPSSIKEKMESYAKSVGSKLYEQIKKYVSSPKIQKELYSTFQKNIKKAMVIARDKLSTPEFKAEIVRIAKNTISIAKKEFDKNPPESFKKFRTTTIVLISLLVIVILFMLIGGILSFISIKKSRDQAVILEKAIDDKKKQR